MELTLFFILMLVGTVAQLLGFGLPAGVLGVTFSPITRANCRGRAGVKRVYVIDFNDLDHTMVTTDADDQFTALTEVATKTWARQDFTPGTAFLNQEKTVNGSSVNHAITLSMNFSNDDNTTRSALKVLDSGCDVVAYVVMNNGATKVAGMLGLVPGGGTGGESLGMATGPGSFNSGADPAADESVRIVTLVCNSAEEVAYTTVTESTLAV